jgi:hypothetical protein
MVETMVEKPCRTLSVILWLIVNSQFFRQFCTAEAGCKKENFDLFKVVPNNLTINDYYIQLENSLYLSSVPGCLWIYGL